MHTYKMQSWNLKLQESIKMALEIKTKGSNFVFDIKDQFPECS